MLRLATSLSAQLDKVKKQYDVLQSLQEEIATSKATRPATIRVHDILHQAQLNLLGNQKSWEAGPERPHSGRFCRMHAVGRCIEQFGGQGQAG